MCACVRACVHACVRVRACVCMCVCVQYEGVVPSCPLMQTAEKVLAAIHACTRGHMQTIHQVHVSSHIVIVSPPNELLE